MYDAVVSSLSLAMEQAGINSLCFNFRGVGRSEGQHDQGVGEQEDTIFLVEWLKQQPGIESVLLGGYSFGALLSLKIAAAIGGDLSHLMLVAPPIQDSSDLLDPGCAVSLIVGGMDNIVDIDKVRGWASQCTSPVELVELSTADHFFMGYQANITAAILAHLGQESQE